MEWWAWVLIALGVLALGYVKLKVFNRILIAIKLNIAYIRHDRTRQQYPLASQNPMHLKLLDQEVL